MAEQGGSPIFRGQEVDRPGFPWKAILVAAGVLLLALAIVVLAGLRGKPAEVPNGPDAYAGHLPISQLSLSEATNGAGGRSTFVDGLVTNTGAETVRGVTVRVQFAMSDGHAPHIEMLPLQLIRTREPYVDLQPVSATPLRPGESREFRLIFETIPTGWNVQAPEILVVHADR